MTQIPFRAPAYPLINIDPYTSIWSMADRLTDDCPRFWTQKPCGMLGLVTIDGTMFRFMGQDGSRNIPAMEQTVIRFDSFSTIYTFEANGMELTAVFTSPLLPDDLLLLSRPVTYLKVAVRSLDGEAHAAEVRIEVSGRICLDDPHRCPLLHSESKTAPELKTIRLGGQEQAVLGRSGDGIGIDWGWFYLSVDGRAEEGCCKTEGIPGIYATTLLRTDAHADGLFLFAYDDVHSLTYFGKPLDAYWKKGGTGIERAVADAYRDYSTVMERCREFDARMTKEAVCAGGEKYSQLLQLALRQVMAGHKLVLDPAGEILYISKECFSNGCAATTDISYPSVPLFLLYNPELIKGMLRPVFRYAESRAWPYDFAPHDVGTYPILNGQVYSEGTALDGQMPVEECGNMLIMATAQAKVAHNAEFAKAHRGVLRQWAEYLLKNGLNPENQLCTDDFAGHLAHNCNLSLKAIMGLMGYALLCEMWGDSAEYMQYRSAAENMAESWLKDAANGDGSYRLAFDRPGSYSMKYNAVWDKVWKTGLFPSAAISNELNSYAEKVNPYGLPLDNRADYTKSDWLVWTASMFDSGKAFADFIEPLWLAYHKSPSRVPMTDWFSTVTSLKIGFQHRTVQGGLWMRMLMARG